jgi:signal transduction histidine kinase
MFRLRPLIERLRSVATGGRIIWAVCFALLVISSPLVVRDLADVREAVEQASGADYWYESQLNRQLQNLKLVLTEARLDDQNRTADDIRLQLDLAFSSLNNLPDASRGKWYTQGIAKLPEIDMIRDHLQTIDDAWPLLSSDRPGFLLFALEQADAALTLARKTSLEVMQRQNTLTGQAQALFYRFHDKLVVYGIGALALLLGLIYLMSRHMRSERELRDTNRRLTELADRLAQARDDAVRANQAKGTFLANVSHELRTPLNAIIGFSEMLEAGLRGPLNARQAEYVTDIHRSAGRLLMLISDILDLAKIEAGKVELVEETVQLGEIVTRAVRELREQFRLGQLDMEVDISPALPTVRGDSLKLRQIVDNLLSNAIKFTDPGGTIRISLGQLSDRRIRLSVADTGIGIPEAELPRIFKVFEQANSKVSRARGGSGLGLTLVKAFVELHGGTISVTSQVNVGTTFIVDLPGARAVGMPALLRAETAG